MTSLRVRLRDIILRLLLIATKMMFKETFMLCIAEDIEPRVSHVQGKHLITELYPRTQENNIIKIIVILGGGLTG